MKAAVWIVRSLNWLVPGLTYFRALARQPIERGMNDEAAIKVGTGGRLMVWGYAKCCVSIIITFVKCVPSPSA